jgi:Fe-S-cluster-containing dehydrogenase component
MPPLTGQLSRAGFGQLTRRRALQLMAAQMAAAVGGCSKPVEEIVPYVVRPETVIPGEFLRFATALPLSGYARGVHAISTDGRPIKIEGNPLHPASLGATDVFAEAAILSLYDPDRSRTTMHRGDVSSWNRLNETLIPERRKLDLEKGAGFAVLTGRITSPTLLRQIDELLDRYPEAVWYVHEPIDEENEREGSRLAFGRPLHQRLYLDQALTILSLDTDLLGPGPNQIRHARDWVKNRKPGETRTFSRLYVAEHVLTNTGAKSDHRIALHPRTIANVAIAIGNALGAGYAPPELDAETNHFVKAAATQLIASRGRALVTAGPTLPAQIHGLVQWINHQLQAPVDFVAPLDAPQGRSARSLSEFSDDLKAERIKALVVISANPAYDAPAQFDLKSQLKKVPFSLHLGSHMDETGALCQWHVPQCHPLENWSDIRATDGTASIIQPLIAPLHASYSAHDLLEQLLGRRDRVGFDAVQDTWKPVAGVDFASWWRQSLHDGLIANTRPAAANDLAPALPHLEPAASPERISLVLRPDPSVWDGSLANNPWLQECPKPLTKQVWGHALSVAPDDASRLDIRGGDVVNITLQGKSISAIAQVESTTGRGVAALTVGYGRRNAGAIGNHIGANAYPLRTNTANWTLDDVVIASTGETRELLSPQHDVRIDGQSDQLYPMLTLPELADRKPPQSQAESLPSLLPAQPPEPYAWGMVIDTAACIGCNACVVACQAENNVPVVGPEEIARGRDMHWLRIDTYIREADESASAGAGFQPVPCMHCEHAPCEPVCPVAASVHDGEGLNLQVYNRCVGTRFCEANCPYKVRRFNFFGYADGQEYANLGAATIRAQHNPDVSTRQRGVMEKCTYCVQRISRARRAAEKSDREIADGEVVTACQSACPTQAIRFGNLADADSRVTVQKKDARNYALLGHLGTRPRTTYLADIRNPDIKSEDGGT